MAKSNRGGQKAGGAGGAGGVAIGAGAAAGAPTVTPTSVVPPTPAQVAAGNVLPTGGVAFDKFEQMTDDEKAQVVTDALGCGVPMFLEDSGLQRFAYYTGMSKKPNVVSDAQLDKMQGTEIYRGVHDAYNRSTDIGYSSNDIYKQVRDGDFTMFSDSGGSAHGKAIYFGSYSDARMYAQGGHAPLAMRAKITSGKVINESTLSRQYSSALKRGDKLALACSNAGWDSSRNLYALAKGYSAIDSGGTYKMVLRRDCLSISTTTKNPSARSSW